MADNFEAKFRETVNQIGDLIWSVAGLDGLHSSVDKILRDLYPDTAAAYAAYRLGE